MTANSSCDWPSSDPRFALTPTTRKWTPSIWMILSIGSTSAPNSRSAVCQPMTATGRLRLDFGRAHQPAALGVEAREVDVLGRHALHLRVVDRLVAVGDAAAAAGVGHHRRDQSGCSGGSRAASSSVMRGLLRTFSNSSSLRVIGNCWMLNESAPAWLRIAVLDRRVQPLNQRHHGDDRRHRDDVAEHGHERPQLGAQIASSAISADSKNLFISAAWTPCGLRAVVDLHRDRRPPCRAPSCTAR